MYSSMRITKQNKRFMGQKTGDIDARLLAKSYNAVGYDPIRSVG